MKKENRKQGHLYGARAVLEAMRAGRQLDKILMVKNLENQLRQDVSDMALQWDVPIQMVPMEAIEKLARGQNHQGVFAYASLIGYVDLEQVLLGAKEKGQTPLIVLLDGVTDVRNFGAIARTAECMGAHALVVPSQGSAQINADAIKASAGALNHLAVSRVKQIIDAVFLLKQYEVKVFAITEKANATLFDADFSGPTALVLGAEGKGIEKRILKHADELVQIPMTGRVDSLNVSVAAGMALLETARQRQG